MGAALIVHVSERPETWVTNRTGHIGNSFALARVSMPCKEFSVIVERLRFVARLLEGEAMSDALPGKGAFLWCNSLTNWKALSDHRSQTRIPWLPDARNHAPSHHGSNRDTNGDMRHRVRCSIRVSP